MKCTLVKALALGAALLALPALAASPDWLITSKAKLALLTSEVRSNDVHVDTNGGAVTLFGKVPTEEQRRLAERTVSQLEGVRAVTNRLQVAAVSAESRKVSDRALKKDVQQALKNEASLENRGLFVKTVDKGVVTLAGQARSYSDQVRAAALINRVPGVQGLRSEVKNPEGAPDEERVFLRGTIDDRLWSPADPQGASPAVARGAVKDVRITGAVKLALLSNPQLFPANLDVDTENGVVTLFGAVPTNEVKAAAGREAGRVFGVTGVQNQLEVSAAAANETITAKDEDLARDVKRAFFEHPELAGVTSTVKNGVVQLSGYVDTSWGELDAVRLVREVKGVRAITNLLKVEPKETRPLEPGT